MADAKAPATKPLSPHLQIYRWSWTMAMSIAHRVTGVALYGGTVLLAIWLLALASGPGPGGAVHWFFGSWLGLLILFGYSWILIHHMLGGVRHLIWDFGHGFELKQRIGMAKATLIGSVSLTVLLWVVVLIAR